MLSRGPKRGEKREPRPLISSHTQAEFVGTLADRLGIGVLTADLAGVVRYANATFRTMLGLPLFGTGFGFGFLLSNRISAGGKQEFERAMAQARFDVTEGEFEILTPEGNSRTVRVSMGRLGKRGKHLLWMIGNEVTELREKDRDLLSTKASLHSLSGRLLQTQDTERRRLARDLHDITGQELAVIVLSLAQLANNVSKPGFDAQGSIAETEKLVRKVESEIRTVSYLLHPPMLDELGLRSALAWYVEGFVRRSKIEVELDFPSDLPRLSTNHEIAIFRVVQEGLTNVLRHSGSTSASLRARSDGQVMHVFVEDYGRGFSAKRPNGERVEEGSLGVGILGMRERLQQLGGTLTIRRMSKGGTQVCATIPLDQATAGGVEAPASPGDTKVATEPSEARPNGRRSILVVEDHEVVRRARHFRFNTRDSRRAGGTPVLQFRNYSKHRGLASGPAASRLPRAPARRFRSFES